MKKSILSLEGVEQLSTTELKSISGGAPPNLPCGAVCTNVGNRGCASGKCEMTLEGVAYCIC
ncbi:bacteriocin [Flavobacterium qiangtangense]|uniref:Bacteriocin n=1 Tax=Flavobacterium qiangtangense TaxID=1442595 RepID=A0ABW1PLI4_9FLAO